MFRKLAAARDSWAVKKLCCCESAGQEYETIGVLYTIGEESVAPVAPRGPPVEQAAQDPAVALPSPREWEKARIEALMSKFARQAVKGVACTLVEDGEGACVQTRYRITKGLEELVVPSPSEEVEALVRCPLAAIRDIYTAAEDGQSAFQEDLLRKIDAGGFSRDLLIMVVYAGGADGQESCRFYLVLENRESRDTFLECLRILCLYAVNRQKR